MRRFFYRKSVAACIVAMAFAACSSDDFQSDADVYRLQDLEHYGTLIEAYKTKTGQYPLFDQVDDLPVYAVIASPEQVDDVQPLPFAHVNISPAQFFDELEKGLGRPIEERYDPQFEPDKKPNFYIYTVGSDRYFFAVHVSQPFSFTQDIGPGYHKVEVSNRPGNDSYASMPEALFKAPGFLSAKNKSVSKPQLFDQRRQEFADVYPTKLTSVSHSLRD